MLSQNIWTVILCFFFLHLFEKNEIINDIKLRAFCFLFQMAQCWSFHSKMSSLLIS